MTYHPDDTICAIATAAGGAARGMVRISGRETIVIASRLFYAHEASALEQVRRPTALSGHVNVRLDSCRQPSPTPVPPDAAGEWTALPCDLLLWPSARSYTREPVAEFHTFGSPPLLEALLATVCRSGARLAEPGEFTLRAFLAGRLDLTQAEAVLGVIDARSKEDFSGALSQLAGGLAAPLQQLRDDLLQLLADLEAGLDFVDEDIEFVAADDVRRRLGSARELLARVDAQLAGRHAIGRTLEVALVGEPNVGKSSLFNALLARRSMDGHVQSRRQAPALVAPQRGTTRDYLTATIALDGLQCELVDTAGVDGEPSSPIERAAQARAVERRDRATIRVGCVDASTVSPAAILLAALCDVIALTKADIAPQASRVAVRTPNSVPVHVTSSRTGAGLDALCATLRELLSTETAAEHGRVVAATADRCRDSIRLAAVALDAARDVAAQCAGNELLAAELRIALVELGKVVGAVYTDDLLDRIFSSFCIGK